MLKSVKLCHRVHIELGVTFTYNGFFKNNVDELIANGNRAIFSLIKKARKGKLPVDIQLDQFDRTVLPII